MELTIRRGDIVLMDFGQKDGSVQAGMRPAVVIQNDVGNKFSPTVIVAPMTSRMNKAHLPTHVVLQGSGLNAASMVLAEQIRTIDKSHIVRKVGMLTNEQMEQVNTAVRISIAV